MTAWPTVPTVTVEMVPDGHQRGPLTGWSWTVVRRLPDRTMQVHPPEDADELAMHPVEYARLVAEVFAAQFLPPPSWLGITRIDETTWSCWDTRLCAPHGVVDCAAPSCVDDDPVDVTTPPVPALILTTRPEVLAHAAH